MQRRFLLLCSAMLVSAPASAQQDGFYTTRDDAPVQQPSQPLPWLKQGTPPQAAPQGLPPGPGSPGSPFMRGTSTPNTYQPVIQGGPTQQAVPVDSFDAIEVTEPPAPVNPVLEANPAEEDPSEPTELTSPLFSAQVDNKTPRTIKLSVLNKVTARAETLTAKPGELIEFGKLQIKAISCYQSVPTSQPDSVALLSIHEHIADQEEPKLLFHGWMYASSPSITALEHPVYDVTMMACEFKAPAEKPADALKDEKKKDAKAADKKKN